jgi:hypothetical protein
VGDFVVGDEALHAAVVIVMWMRHDQVIDGIPPAYANLPEQILDFIGFRGIENDQIALGREDNRRISLTHA